MGIDASSRSCDLGDHGISLAGSTRCTRCITLQVDTDSKEIEASAERTIYEYI